MEIKVGIESLESYKRLSYKIWYALAEFVDNSTQSYENNKNLLDGIFKKEKEILKVEISYSNAKKNGFIQIKDNSIGMNIADLERALHIGNKPVSKLGRSKYGMGLKTAAFWFGDKWEVITKKYNDPYEYKVVVDLNEILRKHEAAVKTKKKDTSNVLKKTQIKKNLEEHYTIIRITNLNRTIPAKAAKKTTDYLRSIYRYDLTRGNFALIFQNNPLKWNKEEIFDKLLKDDEGIPFHKNFKFEIDKKKVMGWAGILETGSRRDAGFSLLQANRVIQGWPNSYRPEKLFGDQEGGINDLVNQRLFGEIFLDGFDVSHTKDEILFNDDEEEKLNEKLFEVLADYKKVASEYRKYKHEEIEEEEDVEIDFRPVVTTFFKNLSSAKFTSNVREASVLPNEVIEKSNTELFERVSQSGTKDKYSAKIAGLNITVYINSVGSVYDPYLVVKIKAADDSIGIVINQRHPYWRTMKEPETIFHFIEHCIFDGIAEWKAIKIAHSIEPNTIKMIKDGFLRQELFIS